MEKKVSGKHSSMNGFAMMKGRVATVVLASALLLGGGLTAQAQNAALTTCSQSAATAIPQNPNWKVNAAEWQKLKGEITLYMTNDMGRNGYYAFGKELCNGNSGGALVNTRGELIGINAMLYSQTGSFSGYGFAIPTSIMNKVVADLKQYGTVQRALIGIQGQDVKNYVDAKKDKGEDVDLGTMEGIYVAKVSEESAAEEAGMKEGDVITAIDGKPVGKMAELQEVLAKKRPGDKVSVTYLRDKKKATKTLTLKNEKGNTQVVKKADLDVLGGNFRAVTDAQKEQLNIGYGLEVLKVNAGKLKNAGITKGFIIQRVNDSAVKTIEDLQNAVKEASTSKDPVLYIQGVYPTGKKAYFAVPLED